MNCYSQKQQIVDNLFERFKYYSVPKSVISDVIDFGLKAGLSLEQSEVGARASLSKHYNFEEYFSVQDVMAATGMSEQEVNEAKKQAEKEIIARGEDPQKYFPRVTFAAEKFKS